MLVKCKLSCGACSGCRVDEAIPCSPDCENLTLDGKIHIKRCVAEQCDALECVFGTADYKALLEEYGDIADYPYKGIIE